MVREILVLTGVSGSGRYDPGPMAATPALELASRRDLRRDYAHEGCCAVAAFFSNGNHRGASQ